MGQHVGDVRWHPGTADADQALRHHLVRSLGPGTVTVGRLCPWCGSDRHGRPWARHPAAAVHVSLSRAGGHLVTALSTVGPVGVDLEVVVDVDRHWSPDLVLADGESADDPDRRAWIWAAKEAVLKRRGTGLVTPMPLVRLGSETGLRSLPSPGGLVAVFADASPAGDGASVIR